MSETFAERWANKEREYGLDAIASEIVSCREWMLPRVAAPCLTFDLADHPQHICQVYGHPSDWSGSDQVRLERYQMIGSDGAGNPLCVEQETGAVWLLDHEDRFHSLQFVNSSIPQLAECLLAYLGEQSSERFRLAIQDIDPTALGESSFWTNEAVGIEADEEDYPFSG